MRSGGKAQLFTRAENDVAGVVLLTRQLWRRGPKQRARLHGSEIKDSLFP